MNALSRLNQLKLASLLKCEDTFQNRQMNLFLLCQVRTYVGKWPIADKYVDHQVVIVFFQQR